MNFEVPPGSSLIKKYICRPPDRASIAPISIATMQDTSLIELRMGETLSKQLSSGKQITLVGGY